MRPTLDVPMPPAVARRPRDHRGFPIPVTTNLLEDGTPDFTLIDLEAVYRCIEEAICAICGEPLEYWKAIVGGPLSFKTRKFSDPPMHVVCAHYALQVCPFLALPTTQYAKRHKVQPLPSPGHIDMKPVVNMMGIIRGYTYDPAIRLVTIDKPKTIRVYPYESHGVFYIPTTEQIKGFEEESMRRVKEQLAEKSAIIKARERREFCERHGITQ